MQNFGTFTRYTSDNSLPGEIWLKNGDGQDFYALRSGLAAADAVDGAPQRTYLTVTAGGQVQVANDDVDLLFPQDLALVAVDRLSDAAAAVGKILQADGTLADPSPAVPSSASKLGLVRALREKGDWATVKAALAGNEDLQDDWDAAQAISRTDPLTQAMIATMKYTDADVDALLVRAAALATT